MLPPHLDGEPRRVIDGPLERVVEAVPRKNLLHQRQADAFRDRLSEARRCPQHHLAWVETRIRTDFVVSSVSDQGKGVHTPP